MAETILFVAIIVGGLAVWFAMGRERPARFRRKPVLTGGDLEFFYQLRYALPECLVCPQVAVAALIEPTGPGKARQTALDNIYRKTVGYAVFDEDMQLVVVVELNHRSRPTRKETARDVTFESAGIRTIRFYAKRLPSETKIRSSVYARSAISGSQQSRSHSLHDDSEIQYNCQKSPWRNTVNVQV
jgi:hypothetical protein